MSTLLHVQGLLQEDFTLYEDCWCDAHCSLNSTDGFEESTFVVAQALADCGHDQDLAFDMLSHRDLQPAEVARPATATTANMAEAPQNPAAAAAAEPLAAPGMADASGGATAVQEAAAVAVAAVNAAAAGSGTALPGADQQGGIAPQAAHGFAAEAPVRFRLLALLIATARDSFPEAEVCISAACNCGCSCDDALRPLLSPFSATTLAAALNSTALTTCIAFINTALTTSTALNIPLPLTYRILLTRCLKRGITAGGPRDGYRVASRRGEHRRTVCSVVKSFLTSKTLLYGFVLCISFASYGFTSYQVFGFVTL